MVNLIKAGYYIQASMGHPHERTRISRYDEENSQKAAPEDG